MSEPGATESDEHEARAARPDVKRARILDAALTEFADKGYERASTNAIAERADVAKGLVFHRFGSKEALFYAVCDHVIATLEPAFARALDDAPRDLFERVIAWTRLKLALMSEEPRHFRFFLVALPDAPRDVRAEAMRRMEALMGGMMGRLTEGVDMTRLRAGVTPDEALAALMLLSQGFERSVMPLIERHREGAMALVEATLVRATRMFELLRDGVYGPAEVPDDRRDEPRR